MTPADDGVRRRTVLAAVGSVGALALAGCSGGGGDGDGGAHPTVDDYLSDTSNYDGDVVDETGSDAVTVRVGVDGNSGTNAFAPAAVRVSAGTTVTWEWTGDGMHNVVGKNADFESDLSNEEGHTFEQTFGESGTVTYFCRPHKAMGMRGVVVVE